MKKILYIAPYSNRHVQRFISLITKNLPEGVALDYYDNSNSCNNQVDHLGFNNIYTPTFNGFYRYLLRAPKVRVFFYRRRVLSTFKEICKKNHYDLINMHFLPGNSDRYVNIAHQFGARILLTPAGSDVLRVSDKIKAHLSDAFKMADFISVKNETGFKNDLINKYNITDEKKFANVGFGSNTITLILNHPPKTTKEELAYVLNVPPKKYYICIGYNAFLAQRHVEMIDALGASKELLPDDYIILIPLTYGKDKQEIKNQINERNRSYKLDIFYLEQFLTEEQTACLRIITDLFIHIQTTDAYNSSLQEFILADTECINGKWLKYPSLEKDGYPYHVCETPNDLPVLLKNIFKRNISKPFVPESTKEEIKSNGWDVVIKKWINIYTQL